MQNPGGAAGTGARTGRANNGPAPHEVWSDATPFVGSVRLMMLRDSVAIAEMDE